MPLMLPFKSTLLANKSCWSMLYKLGPRLVQPAGDHHMSAFALGEATSLGAALGKDRREEEIRLGSGLRSVVRL